MMTCNIKKIAITIILMVGKIKNMAVAIILVILVKIQDQELVIIPLMVICNTENVAITIIEYSDGDGLPSPPGRQSGVAKHKEK